MLPGALAVTAWAMIAGEPVHSTTMSG